jgi:hypothetical protein
MKRGHKYICSPHWFWGKMDISLPKEECPVLTCFSCCVRLCTMKQCFNKSQVANVFKHLSHASFLRYNDLFQRKGKSADLVRTSFKSTGEMGKKSQDESTVSQKRLVGLFKLYLLFTHLKAVRCAFLIAANPVFCCEPKFNLMVLM